MGDREPLPPTVAPTWIPRPPAWFERAPSPYAGRPDRPLFVCACPRSGTTLLRLMLDNHPDLAVPQETNFVRPLWWQRHAFGDLRDPANRRRAAEWIFEPGSGRGNRRLRDSRISRRDAVDRVAAAGPTVGSLVEACFAMYAELHGKARWGDKRPAYTGFIAQLLAMFPDAQVVNVVRDPRGAVASQPGMGWDAPEVAIPAAIARWEGAILRADHFAGDLRPDQLLDLRYEDLVADPHTAMRRLCAFSGLRAGEAVEAMVVAEHRNRFGKVDERAAEPVTTASVERWRERLTPAQVVLVEQTMAPLLDRFGYRPAEDVRAAADPAEARETERQRRLSRREWRASQRGELLRRLRYRRPVAAVRLGR